MGRFYTSKPTRNWTGGAGAASWSDYIGDAYDTGLGHKLTNTHAKTYSDGPTNTVYIDFYDFNFNIANNLVVDKIRIRVDCKASTTRKFKGWNGLKPEYYPKPKPYMNIQLFADYRYPSQYTGIESIELHKDYRYIAGITYININLDTPLTAADVNSLTFGFRLSFKQTGLGDIKFRVYDVYAEVSDYIYVNGEINVKEEHYVPDRPLSIKSLCQFIYRDSPLPNNISSGLFNYNEKVFGQFLHNDYCPELPADSLGHHIH